MQSCQHSLEIEAKFVSDFPGRIAFQNLQDHRSAIKVVKSQECLLNLADLDGIDVADDRLTFWRQILSNQFLSAFESLRCSRVRDARSKASVRDFPRRHDPGSTSRRIAGARGAASPFAPSRLNSPVLVLSLHIVPRQGSAPPMKADLFDSRSRVAKCGCWHPCVAVHRRRAVP